MAPGNANSTFGAKRATPLTNPTSFTTFVQADNAAKAAVIYFDPQPIAGGTAQAVNSLRFTVRAWGRATSGTTSNFQAKLQYGISTTSGSNSDIYSLTNRSYVSTSDHWFLTFDALWDATSGKISGNGSGSNLGTADTPSASSVISGVDLTQSNIGLSLAAIFGSSNAGNVCYLDGFILELQ